MSRVKSFWQPHPGCVATYLGRRRNAQRNVRIIAEAVAGRMFVEAIGKDGVPVRFTVKQENLRPLQPGLFD